MKISEATPQRRDEIASFLESFAREIRFREDLTEVGSRLVCTTGGHHTLTTVWQGAPYPTAETPELDLLNGAL